MKQIAVLIFLFFSSFLFIRNSLAAEFSQSFVRLDSNKPNVSLSGTVCASPSSAGAGIEENVVITFPNDFTISATPSNFSTDTTSLPNGSTAWPGIGENAINISNKSIELSSSDLTNGSALYCFNFQATGSTTGSLGEKSGNLTTRNSSNSTIDSSDFGLNIVTNDQITVTAKVAGGPDDYTNSITKITGGGHYKAGDIIEYEISYGSLIDVASPVTIEALWTQGKLDGDSVPSLEVVEYLAGSATNAYSNTPPVIDTVNRKITWTISSFPGDLTNQKVRFKLKVLSPYSPTVRSSFDVSVRLQLPTAYTASDEITEYVSPGNLNPTATPAPSSATTTSQQQDTTVNSVNINTITSGTGSIVVDTSNISNITIYYGSNINSLTNTVTSSNSNSHLVSLDELDEDTIYYFRIVVRDANGTFTSDIYTFKTAKVSSPLLIDVDSLVASSNDAIISSLATGESNILILPVNSDFSFKFAMQDRSSAKSIQGFIRSNDVLGTYDFPDEVSASTSQSVNLIETLSGIYSGSLKTYPNSGNYSLIVRVSDKNGNITEQKLADMKVIPKFTVLSKNDNLPIEGARVLFYVYSPSTKTYHLIPASSISGGNPLFTNINGQLELVLPQGRYKAEITDLRHKEKTVEFEIGPKKGQGLPTVELESTGLTPLSLYTYYSKSANDVLIKATKEYSRVLTGSARFFDLVALATLAGFVFLTFFAFSKRHRIPLTHLPSYFYYLIDRRNRGEKYIHGVVFDTDDKPIHSANVYLMDKEDEKIIAHKKTNKRGEFIFKNGKGKYLIMAMAKHFKTSPVFEYQHKNHLKFKINLEEEKEGLNLFDRLSHLFGLIAGMSFEVLLIGSFIFELLFISTFGVIKTLPFLLLSVVNLLIWILHSHNKSHNS